ncbi:MAG: NADH-quinone oxidoreductase subunit [Herbinix sp.]|nr:NADH-quinone oxidoreductase subunit [Herbinix sp.]
MGVYNQNLVFNIIEEYVDLTAYRLRGGYVALKNALEQQPEHSIKELKASGLRGRGGAAFPTASKIEMVRKNEETDRYIICNADEGEPGTFKDRFIMTHVPFQVIEGITIAAYLAGAEHGYIYVRHEYPEVQEILRESIKKAEDAGLLGENILGSGFRLKLEIFSGAGSYLCGEETALLSSIEGRKGRPRVKPPYPTQSGLWNKPTLINNVETLANIPKIIEKGAEWYRSIGTVDSTGTKLISLSGDVVNRGLIEVPFGITFVDDTRSILPNVHNRVKFFLHESCGKCTPCREGLRQANVILNKLLSGAAVEGDMALLERYTRAIQEASFCGLGQAAGNSLKSSLEYFHEEYLAACKQESHGEEETA